MFSKKFFNSKKPSSYILKTIALTFDENISEFENYAVFAFFLSSNNLF